MTEVIKIYNLPDVDNHSFFYRHVSFKRADPITIHQHDSWEIMGVMSGRGTRIIGDTVEPFDKGEVVLIPPCIPHDWKYDSTNTKIEYAFISFTHDFLLNCINLFPELSSQMVGINYPTHAIRLYNSEDNLRLLINMSKENDWQRLLMLLQLIPKMFLHSSAVCVGSPFRLNRDSERMKLIYNFVMRNFQKEITLDDIAISLNMGRSSFCVFFKKCCGTSFFDFLTKYRLDIACNLLVHSELDVSEICFSVGFNDVPHFNRVFKRYKGRTPREYRKQNTTVDLIKQ